MASRSASPSPAMGDLSTWAKSRSLPGDTSAFSSASRSCASRVSSKLASLSPAAAGIPAASKARRYRSMRSLRLRSKSSTSPGRAERRPPAPSSRLGRASRSRTRPATRMASRSTLPISASTSASRRVSRTRMPGFCEAAGTAASPSGACADASSAPRAGSRATRPCSRLAVVCATKSIAGAAANTALTQSRTAKASLRVCWADSSTAPKPSCRKFAAASNTCGSARRKR
ncbi:hypothetical protein GALL_434460 [mine drainage metagenome]|uniref:Uncharacterized protein n=1 Tax=mine drainage metagenome TaxID=410659 RepID=A0A1J5Q4J1_9ZZZZ